MPSYIQLSEQSAVQLIELTLPQQLDAGEFDALNDEVQKAIDARPNGPWVLDLSNVTYMGSAVLGLMVNVRQRIKANGGKLVLCGLSQRLIDIFHACSLERLFTFSKTRADALKLTAR